MERQLVPEELERWERIDGVIYDMSPAPSTAHQIVVSNLTGEFHAYLKDKTCTAITAPLDVYLDGDDVGQKVQPDLTIVCDSSKIQKNGVYGAPDMVVEVLSPATAKKDKTTKLRAYKASGVRMYWIVDPIHQYVEVHDLHSDHVFPTTYYVDDTITVSIFEDLNIELNDIFTIETE
ncbi:Uma2 family endonuclease [Alicyclobacillus suci]|uniref:Uma2 family endonuclease n=1 Tax=Alicyclobacillus suci TaxID=2816080 RepID=UPI001A8CB1BD|nr:Uma2 family endonuclease [Alicyclobacillus suci]